MKISTFFLLMFLSFSSIAQSEYNFSFDWDIGQSTNRPIRYAPAKHVNQILFTTTKVKNGKTASYLKEYNPNGMLTAFSELDGTNERIPVVTLEYDDKERLKVSKSYKKGVLKNSTTMIRTHEGKPLSQTKVNARNEVVYHNTWTYNTDGCLSESIRYKKGGEKLDKKWVYEYYDKCDKAKSTVYNAKGKIINSWTFACKEEGEQLVKKKDETQVCTWEEYSDEFLTKVYQSFDEKGNIMKNISKYTLVDTLMVEQTMYDENDNLTFKTTYDLSYKKPLITQRFKKGKITYQYEYKYQNDQRVFESYTRKGKLKRKSEYVYKEDGLLAEFKRYNKNNELANIIKLDYPDESPKVSLAGH